MSKSNPILPSEPLSLQPSVIAAEVVKGQDTAQRQLSPRSASKVRRRMDIRNYGRSESRGRSPERDRYHDQPEYASQPYRAHDGAREPVDRGYYERRDGRSHSPRIIESSYKGGYGRNHDEGRDVYRPRNGDRTADYSYKRHGDEEHKGEPMPSRVLGIFGMSKFTSEQNLREIFGRYGPIDNIQVIRDPHDGRSRGFAFISMVDMGDAQKAREALSGTMVHDRRVRVDFSLTSKAHAPTPGKYKGQDTGGSASYHNRGSHHSRFGGGYKSHRHAPYHPRRRANTRDRRRDDHAYKHDGQHSHYSRSKSPRFQDSHRSGDSYRRNAPSYAPSYSESARDREYAGRRMNGGFGSSPSRYHVHEQVYERGYSQRPGNSDERPVRGEYRSGAHGHSSY